MPKNFIGEPFSVSFISGSKNFMFQRPMSRFSFEKFLSHSAGKFRREPFCAVFQKTSGSEKFSDKKGGGGVGASGFSVQLFLYHSAKKLHR